MKYAFGIGARAITGWSFVGAVSLMVAVMLAILGPRMAPVQTGSPEVFWKLASGVDLREKTHPTGGYAYFPDDGWAAYSLSHMHGSDLFRVREDEVLSHFESVKSALQAAADRNDDTPYVRGYNAWQARDRQYLTPARLLNELQRAQRESLAASDANSLTFAVIEEQYFWERWQRLSWYWANFVFEWAFLTGLALLIAWPGIHRLSHFRWAVHAGFFPLLFMSPIYLGYATYSLTSAGPSGGILYPYLLRVTFGGRCNELDRWLLAHTPQVLEPLSSPIGGWVALSGRGMLGPTSAIYYGLLVAVAVVFISVGSRSWKRLAKSKSEISP
jgi:hypothetical protein